jgi:hypothetical protein
VDGRHVILREERTASGSSHLRARVDDNGDVVIEGQDLGETPQRFWGSGEYEWAITIPAESVSDLVIKLGGQPGDDALDLLATRFHEDESHATTTFLDEAGVSYRFWSRVGD